jgi:hypothetical protein
MNYRCTFRCRHCLYGSSPEVKDDIREEQLFHLLDSLAHALPGIVLHLGGGEPMLHFERLCRIVAHARSRDIIIEYAETNGSLLIDRTEEKLKTLGDAGLERLLLSISPFHHEFISYDDTLKVLHAIISILGEEGLFPWHPGFLPYLSKFPHDVPLRLEDYLAWFKPYEIKYQLQGIMHIHPGGRGAYLLARHLRLMPAERLFSINCRASLASPIHAHIDCQGNYLTGFCSGLRIGRNEAFDLEGLFARGIDLSDFPLLERILRGGLGSLYDFALQKGYRPLEGYVSPCHLCLDMRLFLYGEGEKYPELYPDFLYEELRRHRQAL